MSDTDGEAALSFTTAQQAWIEDLVSSRVAEASRPDTSTGGTTTTAPSGELSVLLLDSLNLYTD